MKEKKHFYFIAVIPPAEVCETITNIKQDLANRFQSKHALKVVPHITLKSPFRLPEFSHSLLIKWFSELKITVKSFELGLQDFGCFGNNRSPVIYIRLVANKYLNILHEQVMIQFKNEFPQFEAVNAERNYIPHMTVAYRDLAQEEFKKAWEEFEHKEFSALFRVNNFCLLQHIHNKWEAIHSFLLDE
jgi:2'-5' RNA ligase